MTLANMTPTRVSLVQWSYPTEIRENWGIRPGQQVRSMILKVDEGVVVAITIDQTIHAVHPERMNQTQQYESTMIWTRRPAYCSCQTWTGGKQEGGWRRRRKDTFMGLALGRQHGAASASLEVSSDS